MADHISNSEKYDHIVKWLHKFYSSETVPAQLFEINESTIDVLHKLAFVNDQKDQQCKLLRELFCQINTEYQSENTRLQKINQQLGVHNLSKLQSQAFEESNQQQLISSLSKAIQSLMQVALELEIKDTTMSSFCVGISQVLDSTASMNLDYNLKKAENTKFIRTVQGALSTMTNLQSILVQLESQKENVSSTTESKIANIHYFQSKSDEYQSQLFQLKHTLQDSGFSTDIFHQTLVKLAQQIQDIKKSTDPKLIELNNYNNLPPNATLAGVKLEEAKHQLALLEEQLNFSINQFL